MGTTRTGLSVFDLCNFVNAINVQFCSLVFEGLVV